MALSDGSMTLEQLEQLMREHARLEGELRAERERELARASEPRLLEDAEGTRWTYAVIDGSFVRIEKCETAADDLVIPCDIDGLPVLAIGDGACAKLDAVETIMCPPTVSAIGKGAFGLCANLKSIVLPSHVDDFDPSWLNRCDSLEEIVLPGRLEQVPASVFSAGHVARLTVGANAWAVEPGAFERGRLAEISIDSANPHLATDGTGVYSADGTALWAIARPVERYEVCDGCERVMPKAAYGMASLKFIGLPPSIRRIGELAFARSGIERFEAPSGLEEIAARAFQGCQSLAQVKLGNKLGDIGDSAFEGSGIGAISIPASVCLVGRSIVRGTDVKLVGPDATFSVDEGSAFLYDGRGGLYERVGDGFVLRQMLDERVRWYPVLDGTRAIAAEAFARNPGLEKVFFPEGLVEIGDGAFKGCRRLIEAILPSTVERVGAEAFSGCRLERICVPGALREIGSMAFAETARVGGPEPALRGIEVDPCNGAFSLHDGLLCKRVSDGLRVIAFDNAHESVRFPDDVVEVAPHALGNARGIRELWLGGRIREVGVAGLALWSGLERLHVKTAEPVEGRDELHFAYPKTVEAVHAASTALGGYTYVNVAEIARLCDQAILTCHNFTRPDKGAPSAYDQALLVMGRLSDPVLMRQSDRELFAQLLETYLVEVCVDIARHDDRRALDQMADLGFLNADNIDAVVSAVGKLQDAAMTAHLLEMKRLRLYRDPFDFEI